MREVNDQELCKINFTRDIQGLKMVIIENDGQSDFLNQNMAYLTRKIQLKTYAKKK